MYLTIQNLLHRVEDLEKMHSIRQEEPNDLSDLTRAVKAYCKKMGFDYVDFKFVAIDGSKGMNWHIAARDVF